MKKQYEIEIKYKINNMQEVIKKLNDAGINHVYEKLQVDDYYTPINNSFINRVPIVEWLRIRREEGNSILTYKNWIVDEKTKKSIHCEEKEVTISNYQVMESILISLSFKKLVTVRKHRVSFNYENTIISFDNVEGLGDFIEVEFNGNISETTKIIEIEKYLQNILTKLNANLDEQEYEGYPILLLRQNKLI